MMRKVFSGLMNRFRLVEAAEKVFASEKSLPQRLQHFHFWCLQSNDSHGGFSSRKAALRRTLLCRVEVKML